MINSIKKSESNQFSPYLSVVATSRNDDHGGDPLIRTQIFITNFARQCEKFKLPAELIIVDWNPVADRPGLAAVLQAPEDSAYFQARVITVPTTLHQRIKYSEKLPLFQMIAKNVGIRRAQGQFIVATNIDILFSNELIQFIARQKLNPLKQYRVDRYDIHSGLSQDLSLDETLDYAWSNPIRTNRRYQPARLIKHLYGDELFRKHCIPDTEYCEWNEGVEVVKEEGVWQVRPERTVKMSHLHTNACGDFTLLSRKGWEAIRGYPEFAAYSFNIDSMGMIAAHYAGYTEVALLPPCVCFHIEHGIGSGWTPEGEKKLFDRLREAEILNPEWPVLTPLVNQMQEHETPLEFNHAGWGMADFELPEQRMGDTSGIPADKLTLLTSQAAVREVTATQPAYDLDRLTLAHERRMQCSVVEKLEILEKTVRYNYEKVQIFIPDANGAYREEHSMQYQVLFQQDYKTVVFSLAEYTYGFPLRFDPCESSAIIEIMSITAFDQSNNRAVWEIDYNNRDILEVAGNATMPDVPEKEAVAEKVSMIAKASDLGKRALLSQRSSIRYIKGMIPIRVKVGVKHAVFGPDIEPKPVPISLISNGSDPQIYLPRISSDIGFPLIITIQMKITPAVS